MTMERIAYIRLVRYILDDSINLAMCYCEDCGYQQVEMDVCPKCGSKMITKIDRIESPFVLYK